MASETLITRRLAATLMPNAPTSPMNRPVTSGPPQRTKGMPFTSPAEPVRMRVPSANTTSTLSTDSAALP